jgi:acyl carrier protein
LTHSSIAHDDAGLSSARIVRSGSTLIREAIERQFEAVATAQDKRLAPLSDDLVLLESGLDSLCFAIIVAELEDRLGLDPFSAAEDVYFPVTFGEFIAFYQHAAG